MCPRPTITELPAPRTRGEISVEQAVEQRRSIREFADAPLELTEVSQLLWAAQGITGDDGDRAAPSAGALFPLELYLVAAEVVDLKRGVYRYRCAEHRLVEVAGDDILDELAVASWDQDWIARAPAVLAVAGIEERTARRYGSRARRYVLMEVGGVAENVYLQATAMGLGTTFVGAFDDKAVARLLRLRATEEPLALLPVGRLRS